MSKFQNTTVRSDESTHPLAGLLKIALDPTISVEARLLYVILVMMAWTKGKCWPSQAYQARALGRSDRSIRGYHHELEKAGLLIVERNPGSVNRYRPSILFDTQDGTSEVHCRRAPEAGCRITLKSEQKNIKNVIVPPREYVDPKLPPSPEPTNVNATKLSSQEQNSISGPKFVPQQTQPQSQPSTTTVHTPLTADHLFLVEEIERTTGDTWSRGHFLNLVRQFHEQTIYSALSVTREKLTLESGVNGGAYFTSTLKGMAQLQNMGSYHTNREPTDFCVHPEPKPAMPYTPQESVDPDPVDPEGLINGLRFSYKSGGVQSMLLWAERSVDGVDTHALWGQVKDLLKGTCESDQVHRFLETLKVRLQHFATLPVNREVCYG